MGYIVSVDMKLFGNPYNNYKGLQFDIANREFVKDFKTFYEKDTCYYTPKGGQPIKVSQLNMSHVKNIIRKLGTKRVLSRCPLIYYRYLTESLGIGVDNV